MTTPAGGSVALRASRAFRRLGPLGFARLLVLNLRVLISGKYREHRYAYDRSFDQKYCVDTAGTVAVEDLDAATELRERAHRYEAAEPAFFNFLVDRLGFIRPSDHLFVDVGAGKGRVMLMAAIAGFRRVIGLELDPTLAAIARENIEAFRRQDSTTEFDVVEGDATAFAFPAVRTVLFLNNPFDAELLERLLSNVERAHATSGAEVALLYMHSLYAAQIRARGGWKEIDSGIFQNTRQFYSIFHRPATRGTIEAG